MEMATILASASWKKSSRWEQATEEDHDPSAGRSQHSACGGAVGRRPLFATVPDEHTSRERRPQLMSAEAPGVQRDHQTLTLLRYDLPPKLSAGRQRRHLSALHSPWREMCSTSSKTFCPTSSEIGLQWDPGGSFGQRMPWEDACEKHSDRQWCAQEKLGGLQLIYPVMARLPKALGIATAAFAWGQRQHAPNGCRSGRQKNLLGAGKPASTGTWGVFEAVRTAKGLAVHRDSTTAAIVVSDRQLFHLS